MPTVTSSPRRWWALAGLVLSVLVIGLDATVLNVALPTLAVEIGASTGDLQWIVAAYLVVFASLLLPAGALGDRFGRKRVLLAGLAAFGVASAVATYVDDSGWLIAMRALMGAGAAVIMPLSTSILPSLFPAHERARAIAVWTAGMALGLPLGPIVGGYLLDHFWWGSIFLINIPAVALALAAVAVLVPESRAPAAGRVDLPGGLLSMAGLGAFVYGIIQAPEDGWGDPVVLVAVIGGLAILAAFVLVETRSNAPMLDLGLFRRPVFLWGSIGATIVSLAMTGVLFVVPQYLQAVQGFDAMQTGLRVVPMVAGLMAGGLTGERLLARAGLRLLMTAGLVVIAAGLGMGALTGTGDGYGWTAAWLAVSGAGVGLAMVPAMDGVLATLPEDRTGAGSGALQAVRQVGGAAGVALVGSVLSALYVARLPAGAPEAARDSVAVAVRLGDPALTAAAHSAYVDGMDGVLALCAVLSLATAVVIAIRLRPAGKDTAATREESAGGTLTARSPDRATIDG
ncbi:MFS transporter [Sphaerisporangium melleum]|uniref:MFS transporter n=1 Tax=Sphaerisporangium melleum TaxID=321316 RepID=A0A917VEY0_9ACTN|nr:DHA2 family efflux MFS transporter permease subunit [Sphaerisporangium melleum]GGK68776.1 MFS transporter [Sphaerisporangium melleum]GII68931.1 MFS transporter [Sphaerisporangium melleum]